MVIVAPPTDVTPSAHTVDGPLELIGVPAALLIARGGDLHVGVNNTEYRTLAARWRGLHPELAERARAFLAGGGARETFAWRHGDAVDIRHHRVTLARSPTRDDRCLLSLVEVTAEVRGRESLHREMSTDSLTGLPNRAGFTDAIEAQIAEQNDAGGGRYAVLTVDLDRFSRVNACLGSMAGDELLITAARRLRGALRARDVLARTGGDEFGILLAITDAQGEAEHAARRIKRALSEPVKLGEYEFRVSCSVGIAFGSDRAEDVEDVIRHAQFAMKRAKETGRAEAYQTFALDQARETFAMETRLRRAIERSELHLSFQPICDLATGRVVAFETLARWHDDTGALLSPDQFIPVAEETGLILPLGRWAIDEALRTLAGWDARWGGPCGAAMAVNVSAIQLQRDQMAPMVKAALAANGLAGDRLKLEITESALIADPDRIARALHALKALGVSIAMDDFGTGYSNLAYLQKLPIDLLKIDRSFVTGMLGDRDKVAIVRAILSLAQALGMATVAEGIETAELARTLAALGCIHGQGYAFSRPLDADAAYALLRERNA